MKNISRKQFLSSSALFAAGMTLPFGCSNSDNLHEPIMQSEDPPFPYLEVKASSNYDAGYQIGKHFSNIIVETFKRPIFKNSLIPTLKQILQFDNSKYFNSLIEAANEYFPDYLNELKGICDGSGVDFETTKMLCCLQELMHMPGLPSGKLLTQSFHFGCSDVSYSKNGKIFMVHNEDFLPAIADLLYVVKVSIPGKPTFIGLQFPAFSLGIPPAMNEFGIVQHGNNLTVSQSQEGAPMCFIARSIMDCKTLDEAVTKLKFQPSAYSQHFNLGSFADQKVVGVEFTPGLSAVHNVDGFYVHTNHIILDEMIAANIRESGLEEVHTHERFNILTSLANEYKNRTDKINADLLNNWLSNHDGYPDYVCVHGEGGTTVASSIFDFQEKTWRLYRGNPCYGYYKTIKM